MSDATHRAVRPKRLPRSDVVRPLGGRGPRTLRGGLVVQLDHDAIGVIDEYLPEIAAGNLPGVICHPLGVQPPLHAGKAPADEGDVMDHAGIRLLRLIGPGNIDQVHHRLALRIHPRPRKGKVRPGALFQAQDVLVEPDRIVEFPGPDIEMVKHAYAHAHAVSLPFLSKSLNGRPILAQNPTRPPNPAVALRGPGFMAVSYTHLRA